MKNRVLEYIDEHLGLKSQKRESNQPAEEMPPSSDWRGMAENYIVENPGLCLAVAFIAGVTLAWWIKRR